MATYLEDIVTFVDLGAELVNIGLLLFLCQLDIRVDYKEHAKAQGPVDKGHTIAIDDGCHRVELVLLYFNSYIFKFFFVFLFRVGLLLPLVEVDGLISLRLLSFWLFILSLLLCLFFLFLFQHFLQYG